MTAVSPVKKMLLTGGGGGAGSNMSPMNYNLFNQTQHGGHSSWGGNHSNHNSYGPAASLFHNYMANKVIS